MHRLTSFSLVLLVALAVVASACGSSDDEAPTTPAPTPIVDTFTGVLNLNGAATYSFTVVGTGGITAQITKLDPDLAKPVGLSLGTWNGSICQIVLANDAAIQGSVVVGAASAPGQFCVRVYDAAGTVVQPQTYIIDVEHF
jgi:hypothetical protein